MKNIKMFVLARCPYCKQALKWMDELYEEKPEYRALNIEEIDEKLRPDISDNYDYNLVPAYFVDEVQVHSGAASKELIRSIFEGAL
ncbi:MAG: thioredoxin family protein [Oscillospiraceae bacterium]|nr:thioredoxin family protein [Oscillospiraceae bacterium]